MAKKTAAPKKSEPQANKQLVDAIKAVRHLQDFINQHGSVAQALEAVDRVYNLSKLTGGFEALKQALKIVGGGDEAPAPEAEPAAAV